MSLLISRHAFQSATGITYAHVLNKTRDVKRFGDLLSVASVIVGLKPFKHVSHIVAESTVNDDLFIGEDDSICDAFEARILRVPAMAARMLECQKKFVNGLSMSPGSVVFFDQLERLKTKVTLAPKVMRYILTGAGNPTIEQIFCSSFAMVNAGQRTVVGA